MFSLCIRLFSRSAAGFRDEQRREPVNLSFKIVKRICCRLAVFAPWLTGQGVFDCIPANVHRAPDVADCVFESIDKSHVVLHC